MLIPDLPLVYWWEENPRKDITCQIYEWNAWEWIVMYLLCRQEQNIHDVIVYEVYNTFGTHCRNSAQWMTTETNKIPIKLIIQYFRLAVSNVTGPVFSFIVLCICRHSFHRGRERMKWPGFYRSVLLVLVTSLLPKNELFANRQLALAARCNLSGRHPSKSAIPEGSHCMDSRALNLSPHFLILGRTLPHCHPGHVFEERRSFSHFVV